ncbi:MAG: guanylate kinase [Deltaproteobacteria bacterium]
MIIVSAPSGAGKTTLCQEVLLRLKEITKSISSTTRSPRVGEKHGIDYFFVTESKFKKMILDKRFSEWAKVHGHFYGTDKKFIEENMERGMDVLLSIDVQGGAQLKKQYPDAIMIFVHPPSLGELENRLQKRQLDSPQTIEKRLIEAQKELKASSEYQYHITNDDFSKALSELTRLIESVRKK